MAGQPLTDLIAEVTRAETVEDSAVALVNGIPAMIQTAVDAALLNGATAAELQPLTQLAADLKAKDDALAAAVTANTPAAPSA